MKPFHKPWACTTMMFVGMTFCLPLSWAIDFFQRRKAARKAKHVRLSRPASPFITQFGGNQVFLHHAPRLLQPFACSFE